MFSVVDFENPSGVVGSKFMNYSRTVGGKLGEGFFEGTGACSR